MDQTTLGKPEVPHLLSEDSGCQSKSVDVFALERSSAWFAKGLAFVMSPSAVSVVAVVIVALLLFVTPGHRGPWA